MDLAIDERAKLLKDRLKKYCQKARALASTPQLFMSQSRPLARTLQPC